MKIYSLRKSKHILRHTYHVFQKKKKHLSPEARTLLQEALTALQDEVIHENKERASELAHQIEHLCSVHLKKSAFDHVKELIFALAFALIVAVVIRQVWFEFYEIPSGSMRPTFKEQDRLAVTKTAFGINIPLRPAEFYFDPNLVQRSGIVIFTGENMDIRDVDTMYFYVFPGKKQYIKRMIGKPGDILYFYGGLIYGIDQQGTDISYQLQLDQLSTIDHIPFIDFDRKLVVPPNPIGGVYSPVYIYQMNEPVVKLSVNANNQVQGQMVVPASVHAPGAPAVADYGDLWGFNNYGMVRLLTKDQLKNFTDANLTSMEEGLLYLEIRHHPTLNSVKLIRDEMGRLRPTIGLSSSFIPLQEEQLRTILKSMYTSRFTVRGGVVYRYGLDPKAIASSVFLPHMRNVPDGSYEFYHGKAYEVKWQGITAELPDNHPLYDFDPARVQLLFNLGIEWDTRFSPQVKNQRLMPARYTYFRDGDLYLLGSPVLRKDNPILLSFLHREDLRKNNSNSQASYQPFMDAGPPLVDGKINLQFIRQNGLLIPPNSYLVLGDNHAMSADSREFGFVPEPNLRGAPDFIFWPPGSRWGIPNQPSYPFMNLPRGIVWTIAAITIGWAYLYWRKRNHLPLKF
jgi:signal peptidase I